MLLQEFLSKIDSQVWPKSNWNHKAHLALGMWLVQNHEPQEAYDRIVRTILAYNEAWGAELKPGGGYHGTLTWVWMVLLSQIFSRLQWSWKETDSLAKVYQDCEKLIQLDSPFHYYTRPLLGSWRAQLEIVTPDKQELITEIRPHGAMMVLLSDDAIMRLEEQGDTDGAELARSHRESIL